MHEKDEQKRGPYITVQITNLTASPVTVTSVGLAALKSKSIKSDKFQHTGLVTINGKLAWIGEKFPFKIEPYGTSKIISPRTDFVHDLDDFSDPTKLVAIKVKHTRSDDYTYIGLTKRRNEAITVVPSKP